MSTKIKLHKASYLAGAVAMLLDIARRKRETGKRKPASRRRVVRSAR